MAGQHNLDAHFGSALHYCVEVIHLEPEQHTITVGSAGAIADGAVMMFDFKAVQLQDQPAILHELLIVPAAVSPAAAQQALIPPAAGCNIRNTDERLGAHGCYPNRTPALACGDKEISETADWNSSHERFGDRRFVPHLRCSGLEFDASQPLRAGLTCDAPTALTRTKNHVAGQAWARQGGELQVLSLPQWPSIYGMASSD